MAKEKLTEVLAHDGGNVNVYGKECYGCDRHKADVMVSVSDSAGNIFDLFLTSEQASKLAGQIGKVSMGV